MKNISFAFKVAERLSVCFFCFRGAGVLNGLLLIVRLWDGEVLNGLLLLIRSWDLE